MERNRYLQKTMEATKLLITATIIDLWRLMNDSQEALIEKDRMSASAIMQEIAYATGYTMAGIRKILIENREYTPKEREEGEGE